MELNLSHLEDVTPEKVDFIEAQANRLHDFAIASREMLTKEAHTTLQWLFAIIVGSAGYIITLVKPQSPPVPVPWWLVDSLLLAVLAAGIAALRLFLGALRASPIKPPGNEPKNLATDEQLAHEDYMIRLREVCEMQEPIQEALARNNQVGRSVNEARYVVAALPFLVLILLVILRLTLS